MPVIARAWSRIGHAHRPRRKPSPPLGAKLVEAIVVELNVGRGQPVRIIGGRERTVERPHHADALAGHVGEQSRRLEQVDAEPHAAIAVVGEVDRAFCDRAKLRRANHQLAVENSILERRIAADVDDRRRQALEFPGQELVGIPLSGEPVAAAVDPEREARRRPARQVERRFAAPPCPAAVAGDQQTDRPAGPDPRRHHAVGRRDDARFDVEPVAIGLGVELESDPVAAIVEARRELDQGTALPNIGLAPQSAAARLPADLTANVKSLDRQLTNMDVEAWQDLPAPGAWPQLGQADEADPVGSHAVDVQLVRQPHARRPVEVDLGRGQEGSTGVEDGDVLELRFAEHRSVNPPDPDLEARRGLERGDAVDDETVSRRRVEQHQAARKQEQQRNQQSEKLVEEPARPVPSQPPRLGCRFVRDGDLGHALERLPERNRHGHEPVAGLAVERHAEVDADRSERRIITRAHSDREAPIFEVGKRAA